MNLYNLIQKFLYNLLRLYTDGLGVDLYAFFLKIIHFCIQILTNSHKLLMLKYLNLKNLKIRSVVLTKPQKSKST